VPDEGPSEVDSVRRESSRGRSRQGIRSLTIVTAIAAALFVVLGIGSPLLGQRVFLGVDYLQPIQPWRSGYETAPPTNFCIPDTIEGVAPHREEFRERVFDGDFPLWSSYPSGGTSFGSTPGTAMLSPLNLPFWVLPLWLAPAIAKLVEALIAIGFTFLFLRRVGFSRPASLLAGLVFASSAFLVVWTNWPHSQLAALIPALFWAAERFLQIRTVRAAMPISVIAAVMWLQGYPAVTGWTHYALAGYLLLRSLPMKRRDLRRTLADGAAVGAALALGFGISALQMLPFLYELPSLELADRATASRGSLPVSTMATLPDPFALGTCGSHGTPGYWGPTNDVDTNGFIGVVALSLSVVALVRPTPRGLRRGVRAFFVVATVLCITLIYVGGPLRAISQHLPIFDVNSITRLRSVLGFAFAGLAAVGFDMVLGARARMRREQRARARAVTAVVLVATGTVAFLVVADARRLAIDAGHGADFVKTLRHAAGFGVVAAVAIVAGFCVRGRLRTVALAVLPLVVVAQALIWVWPFWPRVDRELFYPVTAAHRFLEDHIGAERFVSAELALFPPSAGHYGLRSTVGHAFHEERWKDSLEAIHPEVFVTRTFSALPSDPALSTSPMLDRLATRYYVASADFLPLIAGELRRLSEPAGTVELRPSSALEMAAPSGALRGIGIVLARPADEVGPQARVVMELLDDEGQVLARGSRFVAEGAAAGDLVVPIPDEAADPEQADPRTLRITLERTSSPIQLASEVTGAPVLSVQDSLDDGLRLVFSDGVTIYERTHATPRVHWANTTRVIADEEARLEYLSRRSVVPGEVVLSAEGLDGAGLPGRLEVIEDSSDVIHLSVDADGPGYVVVMDAMSSGWGVEIDGRPADLVDADHAGSAVFVDEGEHELVLSYSPRGWRAGVIITTLALGTLVVLWVWGDRLLSRGRRWSS
jgi:hypothetical protein